MLSSVPAACSTHACSLSESSVTTELLERLVMVEKVMMVDVYLLVSQSQWSNQRVRADVHASANGVTAPNSLAG